MISSCVHGNYGNRFMFILTGYHGNEMWHGISVFCVYLLWINGDFQSFSQKIIYLINCIMDILFVCSSYWLTFESIA
jgi:hypothetical protein